ncbi:MAG: prepilin-type N-terminal cleavage/methylation domain-containing protein [Rubrivivax sp.]|nr:MAG: prepilin-type N-terminal cleavage/methylation domain-containing protein [Rubrivivax sp.]
MRQRGFSMIEIVVTMVILGLLLSAALPSGVAWIRNMRIRSTAESIQSGLQRARTEAVRRNTSVSFWLVSTPSAATMDNSCALASTGLSWVVSQDSPDGACGAAPSTLASNPPRIVVTHASTEGGGQSMAVTATQINTTSPANGVTFNGLGRTLNTTPTGDPPLAKIDIQYASANSDDRALRIIVSSSGMILLCDPAISSSSAPGYCPAPS